MLSRVWCFATACTVACLAPLLLAEILDIRIGDCHALFQGIFPNPGIEPASPELLVILYHLSHQGSSNTVSRFLGQKDLLDKGIGYPLQYSWASLVAQLVKNPPAMRETWVWSLGWEDPLEKGKATHCRITGLENSLDCIVHGVARVRHDWATFTLTD